MSAYAVLESAIMAALSSHAPLHAAINGVHRMRPTRATPPYLTIGESLTADWGTKDLRGREVRIALDLTDAAESPARLYGLMAEAEIALEGLARNLDGWRVASMIFLRSRITRNAARDWSGVIEYRVRMLADPE